MDENLTLRPIGRVRSSFKEPAEAPHQGRDAGSEAVVEIDDAYAEALDGIDDCESVVVLCWFHRSRRDLLRVHPRGDKGRPLRGVFATRSPLRPNPVGIYTAKILGRDGTKLKLLGIDAVDGTPVIDIKPHVHRLDD